MSENLQPITPFQVSEFGPDHRLEYFMRNGDTWVRETSKGRTLELPLMTYLLQDPWELTLFFVLGIDHLNRDPGRVEEPPET
jgi:hypothetical protein